MEETVYVKENGVEYKNPVRKVKKEAEGGGWQIKGRKQDSGNMAHFGYQILPHLLQDWCKGHNMSGSRVRMMSGMRRIHEIQTVTGVELIKVIKKGEEGMAAKEEDKTPKINNKQEQKGKPEDNQAKMGNGMEEIKGMLKRMEERITKRISSIDEKVDVLMKRMEPQWVVEREGMDPEHSDSPGAKRFRDMLKKASEEMDATMREINEKVSTSDKNNRQETTVEKGRQGISITQDDKEEGDKYKARTQESSNENEEEGKNSDDEGESSEE